MDEEIASVKRKLRALLISCNKDRMSLKELAKELYETEGEKIPYAKFGFRTLLDFARSIPDVLQLHGRPDDQDALVSVVSDARVSHIQYLVGQNKKKGKPKKSVTRKSCTAVNVGKKVPTFQIPKAKQKEKVPNQSGKNTKQVTPNSSSKNIQQHQYTGCTVKVNNQKVKQNEKLPNQSGKNTKQVTPNSSSKNIQQHQYTGCTVKVNNQKVKQKEKLPNQSGKKHHQPATATASKQHNQNQQHQYSGCTINANTVKLTPAKQSACQSRISRLVPKEMSWDWINCLNLPPEVMGFGWCIEKAQVEHFFKPNTKLPVTVLSIVNPNRLWITTASLQRLHDRMAKDLQSCYGDPVSANRWDLQPDHVCYGLYCAAHWRGKWHRAQIVGPLQIGSQLVKLCFIDFGRTELVHLSSIKYLVKSFQSFPAIAIRASLACVIPREHYWNRNHAGRLYSLLLPRAKYTAYIVDANPSTEAVDIILHDDSQSENINRLLATSLNCKWRNQNFESLDIAQYRNRVKCYSESYPSFLDIEEGRYPTVDELERSFVRGFDFEQHYAQCLHDKEVKQKIFEEHKLTLERIMHKCILSAMNPFASSSS